MTRITKYIKFTLFIFFLFLIQNCSQPEEPGACTDEFVMHSVTVMNPDNNPADSVDITVTNNESGEIYPCGEYLCEEVQEGTYTIMHDGFLENLDEDGEIVTVEGMKDNLQFREEFEFRGGVCHVEKLAGPDTVSLSSN